MAPQTSQWMCGLINDIAAAEKCRKRRFLGKLNGRTDGHTDGKTNKRTDPFVEMRPRHTHLKTLFSMRYGWSPYTFFRSTKKKVHCKWLRCRLYSSNDGEKKFVVRRVRSFVVGKQQWTAIFLLHSFFFVPDIFFSFFNLFSVYGAKNLRRQRNAPI